MRPDFIDALPDRRAQGHPSADEHPPLGIRPHEASPPRSGRRLRAQRGALHHSPAGRRVAGGRAGPRAARRSTSRRGSAAASGAHVRRDRRRGDRSGARSGASHGAADRGAEPRHARASWLASHGRAGAEWDPRAGGAGLQPALRGLPCPRSVWGRHRQPAQRRDARRPRGRHPTSAAATSRVGLARDGGAGDGDAGDAAGARRGRAKASCPQAGRDQVPGLSTAQAFHAGGSGAPHPAGAKAAGHHAGIG